MAKGRTVSNGPEETLPHGLATEDSAPPRPQHGDGGRTRTQILQIVRTEGRARVNELTNRFSSSAVTIRNDLNELHQRRLALRSHGGAVLPDTILRESSVHERLKTHSK